MTDYRIFDRDKFTIIGNSTITEDGIASGFSGYPNSSSWIRVSAVDLNKPCKITCKVNSGDTINGAIFGGGGNNQLGVSLQFRNANTIICYLKASDGTTLIPESYTPTLQTIQSNTNYIATYEWTGTQHFYRIYTEGNIKVFERSIDSALSPHSGIVAIGGDVTDQAYSPFKGTIDLKQFSITVDGVEVFSGSHLANTVEKLQYLRDSKEIIRQSIEAKGVEVPIETPFRQYADKIEEISGGTSSRNRYLEFIGTPSLYPEVTDGILKARLNTKSLSDNIISSSNNLSSNDINTVDIVIPITFNNLAIGNDNNIFFGSYQTSTTNGFCLGINRTNNKLGLWVMRNGTWIFRGEQSTTSDAGETSLTLETNKKYYIRLQMNRITSSASQYIVSYKNNINDDFIEVFNKGSNYAVIGDWNTVTYGSTTILGIYFYCDADIDVKNATLDINTNTTRIIRIGD